MKILAYVLAALVVLVGGFYALNSYIYNEKQGDLTVDYKKVAFTLSGKPVMLGEAGTKYFGNEVAADLNKDGVEDVAFLITQEPGGSGTFFYLLGAIKEAGGWRGGQAMLIGDRIAPQTTEYRDDRVIVNYAERKPGEPFTTPPSVGKSLFAKYDPVAMDFGEVVQNFEGESDLIHVTSPVSGATISSPVTITGEARGMWYFEASFPIAVVDWDGKIIGEGYAQAQGDWMTSEFVPFKAVVTFDTKQIHNNYSNRGTLILKKDNPSALPEHDAAVEIPVLFEGVE